MPSGLFNKLALLAAVKRAASPEPAPTAVGHADAGGSSDGGVPGSPSGSGPQAAAASSSTAPLVNTPTSAVTGRVFTTGNFILDRCLSGHASTVDGVQSLAGGDPTFHNSYWARVLRNATANRWDHQCKNVGLKRSMRWDSGCVNLGSEYSCAVQLELPLDHESIGSEWGGTARKILLKNYRQFFKHLFGSMKDHAELDVHCHLHGTPCSCGLDNRKKRRRFTKDLRHRLRRDMLICGPPCQPFSEYSGQDRESCVDHPLFECIFDHCEHSKKVQERGDSLLNLVKRSYPHALLLEEIEEFAKVDEVLGQSPLKMFATKMMALRDPDNPDEPLFVIWRIFRQEAKHLAPLSRSRLQRNYSR